MNKEKFKIDKTLIFFILIFFIISLLSIYSASEYLSPSLGNLVIKQSIWYLVGFLLIFIIIKFDLNFIIKLAPFIYILNNILLLGLLFFASEINGSKCWYVINGIGSLQPSEFMKISLLLMEVYIIDKFYKNNKDLTTKNEFKLILRVIFIFLIPSVLTFLQPDTGAILVYFFITLFILFSSKLRIRWFILLGTIVSIICIIFFGIYFFKQDMFVKAFGSDFFYRIDRVLNWKNGSGMQLENSLAAIGSSGLFGHGTTPLYFPEAGTDFIFTVFSSNYGFIGSVILVITILVFDLYIISISKNKKDDISKYILAGILSILIYQQVQNISMTIGLLPITGITLPFISYGGSSLLAYMILMGLVFVIYNKKEVI